MWKARRTFAVATILLVGTVAPAAHDVTSRGDVVVGAPNDGDWPSQERPELAIDDYANTKYLHFKGDRVPDAGPTGFCVTPAVGPTAVNGMTFTTANDCPARDPIEFELYGSNGSIDGPYQLIIRAEIFDFNQDWAWPRNEKTTTPIVFTNNTAYAHYEVLFLAIRDPSDGCANSMQIAEVELLALTHKATEPQPAVGDVVLDPMTLQWTLGETTAWHDVYLGTTAELTEADLILSAEPAYPATCEIAMDLEPGATYYWRVDQIDSHGTVYPGDVWHFMAAPNSAYDPLPRNGDKWIETDAVLGWLPGRTAMGHEVYFGTDKDAVAERDTTTFVGSQAFPVYDPGPLVAGTIYYWAVDELDGSDRYEGPVWRFTTFDGGGVKAEYFTNMTLSDEPAVTQIEDSIDHSWNDGTPIAGLGTNAISARWTADLEIAIGDTFTFITTSDDGVRLWLDDELLIDNWTDHGPMDDYSQPLELAPGIYSLQMDWYNLQAGATAQLWWETPTISRQVIPAGPLQPPIRPKPLYPADGDVDVPQMVSLRWSASDMAVMYDVYFGEDAEAVATATPVDAHICQGSLSFEDTTWAVGPLSWNRTYYWRIDTVNPDESGSPWPGRICSFTTADFLIVDDFESYTSQAGQEILQTWIDGAGSPDLPGNGTGATVCVSQTGARSGQQDMCLSYDNGSSPSCSETQCVFTSLQDWTAGGGDDLALWFRGYPQAFCEPSPGHYLISSTSGDIAEDHDHFRFLYKKLNGDGTITARIDRLDAATDWTMAGIMVRTSLGYDSAYGLAFATPNGRRGFQNRTENGSAKSRSTYSDVATIEFPFWVRLEREGDVVTVSYSQDGQTWTLQPGYENGNGSPNPQTIGLRARTGICIGLAVASGDPDRPTVAQFSDVTITGDTSGPWQVEDIGGPNPSNSPGDLYVAVQDSYGHRGTIVHPEPDAPLIAEWTEWRIPLADLTALDVDITSIESVSLGVENHNQVDQTSSGVIHVDDIAVLRP